MAEYTEIAALSAEPEHLSVMLPAIADSRVPQRAVRSAGFGCSWRAASRQAGGVAAANPAEAAMAAKK